MSSSSSVILDVRNVSKSFGDFKAGEIRVGNVHDGTGLKVGLGKALLSGDVLFGTPSGPPLPGRDSPLPYEPGTRIVGVDEAKGDVILDRPARASARALLAPIALA